MTDGRDVLPQAGSSWPCERFLKNPPTARFYPYLVETYHMSTGPPFAPDDESTASWRDWRDKTTPLDYPDRDIRIIFPEEHGGTVHEPTYSPADFGDFDPEPDDPDPGVWPLEHFDPGYPCDVEDLVLWRGSFPAPHVAWVTEEYLEARYGYNPVRQEMDVEEFPEWARPDDKEPGDTAELLATNSSPNRMKLTDDRVEALTRFARLWNGEVVRGQHLLLQKCPAWKDLFGDLDQDELKQLLVDPSIDAEFAEAFGECDWYETEHAVYMKPQRILRRKVWYAPTQRGRTLITRHPKLPSLTGDSMEGLRHRFTVGLAALQQTLENRAVDTYRDLGEYNVDIASQDEYDRVYPGEVMTGHNNWELHRSTYRKLADLHSQGAIPWVIFDSRSTAYEVMNHWHREGLAELPHGTFDSEPKIDWARDAIQRAFSDPNLDWIISDWTTTATLWKNTLGPNGPDVTESTVTSLSW